jgi:hypothetical protein
LRGLEASAWKDKVIKAAMKGVGNKESLVDDKTRAVMTIELLVQARAKLKLLHMSADRKRLIWCVMSFMFLGSMRGSELLVMDRVKFDLVKNPLR